MFYGAVYDDSEQENSSVERKDIPNDSNVWQPISVSVHQNNVLELPSAAEIHDIQDEHEGHMKIVSMTQKTQKVNDEHLIEQENLFISLKEGSKHFNDLHQAFEPENLIIARGGNLNADNGQELLPVGAENGAVEQSAQFDADKWFDTLGEYFGSSEGRTDREKEHYEMEGGRLNVLEYLRDEEKKLRPNPNYFSLQKDINNAMRSIVVDWLYDVAEEFEYETETVQLSVLYMDRFLSIVKVVPQRLQLVAAGSLFIAAKYQEADPRGMDSYVSITDFTYDVEDILLVEELLLINLDFQFGSPTPYAFVSAYVDKTYDSENVKLLSEYISDLALVEGGTFLIGTLPSKIAAAATAIARYIRGCPIWSPLLEYVTTYSLADLKEVVVKLCVVHNDANNSALLAVQSKYKSENFKKVANINSANLTTEIFDELLREYKAENNATE